MVRFGPAGQDEVFPTLHKTTLEMPAYLEGKGLTAFEYQCGHGVRITEKPARALGEKGREHGVALSLHAPYYISMGSAEEEKRDNSLNYILQSARAVDWMGGNRIVVHPGSPGKQDRRTAMEHARETMTRAIQLLDEAHLSHIVICPETMGKIGQLGSLEETLELCALDERLIPCLDFGHLNARSVGGCHTHEQMGAVLTAVENALGRERAGRFHAHFSKIEYTDKGEKRHLTFEDSRYGPDFAPLARLIWEREMEPVLICESAGTQIQDAEGMREIYLMAQRDG